MSTGKALHNKGLSPCPAFGGAEGTLPYSLRTVPERLLKYKELAAAFSYPKKEELRLEYDRLFRLSEIWLYGAEYTAENEFQRVKELSDISGFYRAFGLQVDKERPDALSCELEFMHYLIYKEFYALKKNISKAQEKAGICRDARKKFFETHLYPAANGICHKILSFPQDNLYLKIAKELLEFLETEKKYI